MQATMMHTPSGGVQMPQLSLQQTCPGAQILGPQATPTSPGGSQKISMQPPPSGAQMPQLSLQQYSPAPQKLGPHGSLRQSSSEQGMEFGMQTPPHCGQQVVPSMQGIA